MSAPIYEVISLVPFFSDVVETFFPLGYTTPRLVSRFLFPPHTTTLILDCHSYSFSYYLAYFVSKRHSKVKPSITAQHFFVLI